MSDVTVFKLKNTFIIKKDRHTDFFYTTSDSFIIPSFNFFSVIKFMLFRKLISPKSLEGILEEYYNAVRKE